MLPFALDDTLHRSEGCRHYSETRLRDRLEEMRKNSLVVRFR